MYSPSQISTSTPLSSVRGSSRGDARAAAAERPRKFPDRDFPDLRADALPFEVEAAIREAHRSAQLDEHSLVQLLSQLAKSRQPERTFAVMQWLRREGYHANRFHYGIATSACGKQSSWWKAIELLSTVGECSVEMSTILCNAAISACERGGQWAQALELLSTTATRGVHMDTITYNTAISACEKGGKWEHAVELLSAMARKSVETNTITYSAAISACGNSLEWMQALQLVRIMVQRSIYMNTITYGAAITACEKVGTWTHALKLLTTMAESSVHRNTITCSAAMSACEKAGEWTQALAILLTMIRSHIPTDTIAWSAVVSACEKAGEWTQALALLDTMAQSSVRKDTIIWSAGISACQKAGEWEQALALLSTMEQGNVRTDSYAWIAGISACEKVHLWEEALSLFDSLCSVSPDPCGIGLGSVISTCNSASAWAAGLHLLKTEAQRWLKLEGSVGARRSESQSFPRRVSDSRLSKVSPMTMKVLAQSPSVIAVAKPSGISSQDAIERIRSFLRESGQSDAVTCVSRLDLLTSGTLVVARGDASSASANHLQAQFAGRLVSKTYYCMCSGRPAGVPGTEMILSAPIKVLSGPSSSSRSTVDLGGLNALTVARVLTIFGRGAGRVSACYEVQPVTGRTHQIRVHFASLGRPLVSDPLYNARNYQSESMWCPRLFLHCGRVVLHELDGSVRCVEAPFPADLAAALRPAADDQVLD